MEEKTESSGFRSADEVLIDMFNRKIKGAKSTDERESWISIAWKSGFYPKLDAKKVEIKTIVVWWKYDDSGKKITGCEVYDLDLVHAYVGDKLVQYIREQLDNGYMLVEEYDYKPEEGRMTDSTVIKLARFHRE